MYCFLCEVYYPFFEDKIDNLSLHYILKLEIFRAPVQIKNKVCPDISDFLITKFQNQKKACLSNFTVLKLVVSLSVGWNLYHNWKHTSLFQLFWLIWFFTGPCSLSFQMILKMIPENLPVQALFYTEKRPALDRFQVAKQVLYKHFNDQLIISCHRYFDGII